MKLKIPQKLSRTFKTKKAKKAFEDVYNHTVNNQKNMTHPKQAQLPQKQWETLCWNFACYAAWATQEDISRLN